MSNAPYALYMLKMLHASTINLGQYWCLHSLSLTILRAVVRGLNRDVLKRQNTAMEDSLLNVGVFLSNSAFDYQHFLYELPRYRPWKHCIITLRSVQSIWALDTLSIYMYYKLLLSLITFGASWINLHLLTYLTIKDFLWKNWSLASLITEMC